jgi:hypothetical protein
VEKTQRYFKKRPRNSHIPQSYQRDVVVQDHWLQHAAGSVSCFHSDQWLFLVLLNKILHPLLILHLLLMENLLILKINWYHYNFALYKKFYRKTWFSLNLGDSLQLWWGITVFSDPKRILEAYDEGLCSSIRCRLLKPDDQILYSIAFIMLAMLTKNYEPRQEENSTFTFNIQKKIPFFIEYTLIFIKGYLPSS